MAQELETVYPELVHEDSYGFKSINYVEIIPILVQAINEQQKIITAMQKKIDESKTSQYYPR